MEPRHDQEPRGSEPLVHDLSRPAEKEGHGGRLKRGTEFLEALNSGELLSRASMLAWGVRLTTFDRGQINEAQGRESVCASLDRLSQNRARTFVPTGSRVEDDAVFFWGGSADESGPGWMFTLFFQKNRLADIRIYLMR